MSDTPLTDAEEEEQISLGFDDYCVTTDFARRLERQRNELLEALITAREIIDNLAEIVHGKKADGSTIDLIDAAITKSKEPLL